MIEHPQLFFVLIHLDFCSSFQRIHVNWEALWVSSSAKHPPIVSDLYSNCDIEVTGTVWDYSEYAPWTTWSLSWLGNLQDMQVLWLFTRPYFYSDGSLPHWIPSHLWRFGLPVTSLLNPFLITLKSSRFNPVSSVPHQTVHRLLLGHW